VKNTGENCTPSEEAGDGIQIVHKTEKVTIRERTPANKFKVEAMKDFLDVIGDEDVDKFFLDMMETAKKLGYNLKEEPRAILNTIEKGFIQDVQAETVSPRS
jgi:hypothetical protein